MIVLDRKRLSLIICSVFISVFAFMLAGSKESINTIETVGLPVSGKTVVIDAGHGIPDERSTIKLRNYRSTNKFSYCFKVTKST